ncbi:MAG TPA: hypothetical protein VIF83_06570 [Gemmatimonadaceae bacterium]
MALLFLVAGYRLSPLVLRAAGHSGRIETVEWAVYLSLLLFFPLVAIAIGVGLPRISAAVERWIKVVLLSLATATLCYLLARSDWKAVVVSAALAALTATFAACQSPWRRAAQNGGPLLVRAGAIVITGTAAWMGSGALVSWTDSVSWIAGSVARIVVLAASTALVVRALPRCDAPAEASEIKIRWRRAADVVAVVLLLALSFRTNPVVELYHWSAYTGPMELLRQGGWLLWDVPSQYGFLSILIPDILPGSSWQSFYVFQAVLNAVVALLLYFALRRLSGSTASWIVAVALTACTIFFRPRSATLFLPGQMTPSGGPPRFVLCFVMLAFVFNHYLRIRGEAESDASSRRFAIIGNGIWLLSILWAAEAAIYVSAIWIPAYLLHIARGAVRDKRQGKSSTEATQWIAFRLLTPFAALAVIVGAVEAVYRIALGHGPDYTGYIEYALLYSGGFNSLPVDTTGSFWFLVIFFVMTSVAVIVYLSRDVLHPRVMVVAAAWGGVWAISSYFVSRSHPANLLSITPFVIFAAAVTLNVMTLEGWEPWHDFVRTVLVPAFAFPIFLTLGHPGFVRDIRKPQLSYESFEEQLPLMEASLNQLLLQVGAKPTDPVVRIGDGRLVLPAWRDSSTGGTRVMSAYSWLPKHYELIGSLPPARRQIYIDRNARDLRLSGWLVHSKKMTIPGFEQQLAQIQRTHRETKRFENDDWIVSWYELRRR